MHTPSRYGRQEAENLDPTPIEMPLGFQRPTPLHDLIARMVRDEIQLEKSEEFETPDEASDFEEDDPHLLDLSPYTLRTLADEEPLGDWNATGETSQEKSDPEPPQTGDQPDPHVAETG